MADQPHNAEKLVKLGVGLSLDVTKFTSNQVRNAVSEVLSNPNYGIKMKELQALEATVSKTTSNKVIEAVEYVRRFGSKNLLVKKTSDWKKKSLMIAGAFFFLKTFAFVIFILMKRRRRRLAN